MQMQLMPPDLRPRLEINQGPDGQEAQNFGFGEGMGMLGQQMQQENVRVDIIGHGGERPDQALEDALRA